MAVSDILSGLGQFLLVVALSFAVITLLASHIRFQHLAQQAAGGGDDVMDPGDAFQVRIAHLLGTAHRAPEPFCVMLARPEDLPALSARHGAEVAGDVLRCLEAAARKSVRAEDAVVRVGEDRIGLILNAPRSAGEALARRLVADLQKEPCRCASGPVLNATVSAGLAFHPENGDRTGTLIDQAAAALAGAAAQEGPEKWVVAPLPAGGAAGPPAGAPPRQGTLLDPLTGVLRPERLGMALQKYVARFRKQGRPVSVLVVDIDHFHRYNEHYGKSAGDQILKGLGELLQRSVREHDLIGRLAGEEFIVAMGCSPQDALLAGQRLVSSVKRSAFAAGPSPPAGGPSSLRITVSVGVAGYPDHGGNPRHLLEAAGAALEAAKDKGRNMGLLYAPTMRVPSQITRPRDVF